jgi:hypothetical protein
LILAWLAATVSSVTSASPDSTAISEGELPYNEVGDIRLRAF